ncbi:hypothetical protein ACLOJK_024470 [Asimina triloba]
MPNQILKISEALKWVGAIGSAHHPGFGVHEPLRSVNYRFFREERAEARRTGRVRGSPTGNILYARAALSASGDVSGREKTTCTPPPCSRARGPTANSQKENPNSQQISFCCPVAPQEAVYVSTRWDPPTKIF